MVKTSRLPVDFPVKTNPLMYTFFEPKKIERSTTGIVELCHAKTRPMPNGLLPDAPIGRGTEIR